jgi:hypothetical protein
VYAIENVAPISLCLAKPPRRVQLIKQKFQIFDAAASADIARVLFYIFVVIFLVLLILGLLVARRV